MPQKFYVTFGLNLARLIKLSQLNLSFQTATFTGIHSFSVTIIIANNINLSIYAEHLRVSFSKIVSTILFV